MAVEAGALVEPAVAEGGIDAQDDAVLRSDGKVIGEVEAEGRIAVVVAADEAAVDEDKDAAEGAVEFDGNAAILVGGRDVELAAIPAHAGLRVAASKGLISVRLLHVVMDERQLDGPVMGQVDGAPFGVVQLAGLRELELAGLGKVSLAGAEAEVACGVRAVAQLEAPAIVEQQLLARGKGAQRFGGSCASVGGERGSRSGPCRAGDER